MEETATLLSHSDDSIPDYETFCFDIKEKSSGSTASHSDHSLPDYEALCFDIDHQEEKSSGSTTSHSDISLPNYESFCFDIIIKKRRSIGSTTSHTDPSLLEYESFYIDLSIDPLPPAEKSDSRHEELADELAHIISLPEYDHFYFETSTISETSTKDLTIHELNDFPLLLSDCDSSFSEEFSEIDLLVSFSS
ncbi:hypothetical protein Tco_0098373 [Tanacetum coccineum]